MAFWTLSGQSRPSITHTSPTQQLPRHNDDSTPDSSATSPRLSNHPCTAAVRDSDSMQNAMADLLFIGNPMGGDHSTAYIYNHPLPSPGPCTRRAPFPRSPSPAGSGRTRALFASRLPSHAIPFRLNSVREITEVPPPRNGGPHAPRLPSSLSPAQPLPFISSTIFVSHHHHQSPSGDSVSGLGLGRAGASGPSSCRSTRRCRRHVAVASSGSARSATTTTPTPRCHRRRSRRCCSSGNRRRRRSLGPIRVASSRTARRWGLAPSRRSLISRGPRSAATSCWPGTWRTSSCGAARSSASGGSSRPAWRRRTPPPPPRPSRAGATRRFRGCLWRAGPASPASSTRRSSDTGSRSRSDRVAMPLEVGCTRRHGRIAYCFASAATDDQRNRCFWT